MEDLNKYYFPSPQELIHSCQIQSCLIPIIYQHFREGQLSPALYHLSIHLPCPFSILFIFQACVDKLSWVLLMALWSSSCSLDFRKNFQNLEGNGSYCFGGGDLVKLTVRQGLRMMAPTFVIFMFLQRSCILRKFK